MTLKENVFSIDKVQFLYLILTRTKTNSVLKTMELLRIFD